MLGGGMFVVSRPTPCTTNWPGTACPGWWSTTGPIRRRQLRFSNNRFARIGSQSAPRAASPRLSAGRVTSRSPGDRMFGHLRGVESPATASSETRLGAALALGRNALRNGSSAVGIVRCRQSSAGIPPAAPVPAAPALQPPSWACSLVPEELPARLPRLAEFGALMALALRPAGAAFGAAAVAVAARVR